MNAIAILDTSVATNNLGDEIIMESVRRVVGEALPNAYPFVIASHEFMGESSRKLLDRADFAIVGGTNLLGGGMLKKGALWKLKLSDVLRVNKAVLLGTGWRGYRPVVGKMDRFVLERVLKPDAVHSVRDEYSRQKMQVLSKTAINTSCVTMWSLSPEHCKDVPTKRALDVVTTLTFYNAKPDADREMLETLKRNYRTVFFWPQQFQDHDYMTSLGVDGLTMVPPRLEAFDSILRNEDVDFIGTRLHGGVRALQNKRRTLIMSVDNRATEISRDTGLPVFERGENARAEQWINSETPTVIHLPTAEIARWKAQFQ